MVPVCTESTDTAALTQPQIVTPIAQGYLPHGVSCQNFRPVFQDTETLRVRNGKANLRKATPSTLKTLFIPPLPEVGCIPILLSLRNKERLQLWQHCCDCTRAVSDNTQLSHCWAKVMRASELWKRSWRHRSAHDEAMALGKVSAQVAKAKALLARNYF